MKYFRKMQTTQELRQFYADEADCQYEEYHPSPRRSRRHIRNLWDDVWVSTQRSWKKHRKAQWKPERVKSEKAGKFRGHLSTRTVRQRGKKRWYFTHETGRYYTYKSIRYHEGVGDEQVEWHARIINQPWKVVIWNVEKDKWECKGG